MGGAMGLSGLRTGLSGVSVTGRILSISTCNNVANILLVDRENPKNTTFKVSLWDEEADAVIQKTSKGDEISVTGKVYNVGTNKYGNYVDVRMCKLIGMTKIERTTIALTNDSTGYDSLPKEGV